MMLLFYCEDMIEWYLKFWLIFWFFIFIFEKLGPVRPVKLKIKVVRPKSFYHELWKINKSSGNVLRMELIWYGRSLFNIKKEPNMDPLETPNRICSPVEHWSFKTTNWTCSGLQIVERSRHFPSNSVWFSAGFYQKLCIVPERLLWQLHLVYY